VWETNPSRFLVRYLYPQVVRLCLCALLRSRRRPSTRARERDVLLLHHPPKVLSIRGFRQCSADERRDAAHYIRKSSAQKVTRQKAQQLLLVVSTHTRKSVE
jgi:hypothetical protein